MNGMEKKQKFCLIWILAIGIIYFAAMIPFTMSGAKTPEMLEVFEVDEYAQYPHVLKMLRPGETFYQSIRNFVVYEHYYYGYPFYFWSAVSLLPVRIFDPSWPTNTTLIVCILRQMLSVLPMILSAAILCWIVTHFKRTGMAIFLFVFLLTLPAVIQNNFWWHPDSLALFFLTLVFFFLDRDDLACGRNFLFAAACCGAAVGTKYLGFYFALAIPLYLVLSIKSGQISWQTSLKKALLFLMVMIGLIVFSNPLLLLPQERAEILGIMRQQIGLSSVGVFVKYQEPFFEHGGLPSFITENYTAGWFFILAFTAMFIGMISSVRQHRTFAWLVLAYFVLAAFINIQSAARRLHYFLPVILPLFALLPNLYLQDPVSRDFLHRRKRFDYGDDSNEPMKADWKMRNIIYAAVSLPLCIQLGLNIRTDISALDTQWWRESNSSSIRLYTQVQNEILPELKVPTDRMTRVYRDWKIYFPEQDGFAVKTDWEMATQALIDEWQPDIILLENANIEEFSKSESLENAVDPDHMKAVHSFYLDAKNDQIPGYHKVGSNKIGSVFLKNV